MSGVGAVTISSNPLIQPTGLSATSSVGSVVIGIGVPLTGLSATSSVGSVTISTLTSVSLTGVSATVTLSPSSVAPIGWGRVTAEQTGNWVRILK